MSDSGEAMSVDEGRFRFGLRALMLLVLVVGVGLGWPIHLARQQRKAVALVTSQGGTVLYNYQFSNGRPTPGGKHSTPAWLGSLLGLDCFEKVRVVVLSDKTTDSDMEVIGSLRGVEELSVGACPQVSDTGIQQLKGWTNLKGLKLFGKNLTSACTSILPGMNQLTSLTLSEKFGDSALANIEWLTQLQTLELNQGVTDEGMSHLRPLANLKELVLSRCQIKGTGLKYLEGMSQLRELKLDGSVITSLEALPALPGLERLSLNKAVLASPAMAPVAKQSKLKFLDLTQIKVGAEGLSELSQLGSLEMLFFMENSVNPESAAALARFPALTQLFLDRCQFTDQELRLFKINSTLSRLSMNKTQISDAGLAEITSMRSLKWLNTQYSQVTEEGKLAFKKVRPDVNFVVYGAPRLPRPAPK